MPASCIRRGGSPSTSPRRTCARRVPRSTWRWPSASCSGRSRSDPGRGRVGMLGELSLGGEVQPVPGVLPMVAAMARRGVRRVAVARSAAVEAGLVEGVEVLPVDTLTDVVELVRSPRSRSSPTASPRVGLDDDRGTRRGSGRAGAARSAGRREAHPGPRRGPRPGRGEAGARDRPRRRPRPPADRPARVGQDHAREHRAGPPPAARRRGRAVGDDRGVGGRRGPDDRPRPPAAVPQPASHDVLRGDGRRRAAAVAGRDHAGGPRRAVPRRAAGVRPRRPRVAPTAAGGGASGDRPGRARDDVPRPVPADRRDEPVPVRLLRVRPRMPVPDRRRRALPAQGLGSASRPDRPVGRDAARAAGRHRGASRNPRRRPSSAPGSPRRGPSPRRASRPPTRCASTPA